MSEALESGRKISARLGMPRIQRERLAKLLHCFVGPPESNENHAELIVERGARLRAERGLVIRRGGVQFSLSDQIARQVVVGRRVLRIHVSAVGFRRRAASY